MIKRTLSIIIRRVPIIEIVIFILGVTRVAGNLDMIGFGSFDNWNIAFSFCGASSGIISALIDNILPAVRWKISGPLFVLGVALLGVFYILPDEGPTIGLVFFWLFGVGFILSGLLREFRYFISASIYAVGKHEL